MATINQSCPNDPVPDDFLQTTDPQTLNIHLARFIVETRKSNGDLYPPATLHQLLCRILPHMRSKNPGCPNFLDKKDSRFRLLHGTLDSYTTFINYTLKEWEDKQLYTCRGYIK
jgi:hypothetical protein